MKAVFCTQKTKITIVLLELAQALGARILVDFWFWFEFRFRKY